MNAFMKHVGIKVDDSIEEEIKSDANLPEKIAAQNPKDPKALIDPKQPKVG